jgi:hypothetical protein
MAIKSAVTYGNPQMVVHPMGGVAPLGPFQNPPAFNPFAWLLPLAALHLSVSGSVRYRNMPITHSASKINSFLRFVILCQLLPSTLGINLRKPRLAL